MSQAWKCNPHSELHLREWDGEFVVYSSRLASTHLLGPAAGVLLLTFLESDTALTSADLLDRLGLGIPACNDVADEDVLRPILDELEQLELIEAFAI